MRKLRSPDKDNGPTSPTVPNITYDSVFDSGRELSSDVYSTVEPGIVLLVVFHMILIRVKNFVCNRTCRGIHTCAGYESLKYSHNVTLEAHKHKKELLLLAFN